MLDHQIDCLYLKDLLPLTDLTPNLMLMKMLVLNQRQGAEVAKTVLSTAETREEYLRRLSLVETILVNKFPELSTVEIVKMLNLPTADITQSRFYQEVSQSGRQEEAALLVLRLLNRRCGDLSVVLAEKVSALSLGELEDLGVALLDFTDMGDLVSWLGQR
jgi:predicted transposase YdaD